MTYTKSIYFLRIITFGLIRLREHHFFRLYLIISLKKRILQIFFKILE